MTVLREADISTDVTFEDGRKVTLSARVKIRDVEAGAGARPGEGGMNGPCACVRSERDTGEPDIFVHGRGS